MTLGREGTLFLRFLNDRTGAVEGEDACGRPVFVFWLAICWVLKFLYTYVDSMFPQISRAAEEGEGFEARKAQKCTSRSGRIAKFKRLDTRT